MSHLLPLVLLSAFLVACGDGSSPATRAACPVGTSEQGAVCLSATDAEAQRIVQLIREDVAENDLRAVVFGVRLGDETIVVGAVGESDDGTPASRHMHHRVGNVSAGFLTTTLLQLVDEGRIRTDDKLSNWFPELPDADRITIEMLASSTAGYVHFPDRQEFVQEFYRDPFRPWSPGELIALGTAPGTQFVPGTSWLFSDTNLVILGEIVENVEGRPLGESIRERILEPLGLADTHSPRDAALPEPVLHGFTDERGFYEDATFWNPTWNLHSGSMSSNVGDLMTWAHALGTGRLLPPELFELQTAPRTAGLGRLTEQLYYTFGIGVTNGWILTNPSLQGYRELLAYLPSRDLTIVVVSTMRPGADMDRNHSVRIFKEIAGRLAPDATPALPDS